MATALLVQAAHATARTKNSYLAAHYRRLAARSGTRRAAMVVGHSILVIAYQLLRDGTRDRDLGPRYFDEHDRQAVEQRLVRRLEGLGNGERPESCHFQTRLDPFCYMLSTSRSARGISGMVAAINGLDGLVFRAAVFALSWLGMEVDELANRIVSSDGDLATSSPQVGVARGAHAGGADSGSGSPSRPGAISDQRPMRFQTACRPVPTG